MYGSISAVGPANPERLREIDLLRGLVIVLMTLDHVRDYFHSDALTFDPLNPDRTTPILYLTRWATHLCAPTFVLLAGVSGSLQLRMGKSKSALSWLLFTRGLWLVVLELTVLSFAQSFGFPYPLLLLVIWAIGWSMIALAALVWLPPTAVLIVGITIIAGHNLLDPIAPAQLGDAALLWTLFHEGGPLFVNDALIGVVGYPVLPWVGVIALGYGMGAIFAAPSERRDPILMSLGLAMFAAFLVLRSVNQYGDPRHWASNADFAHSAMSFFDVTKYPPSFLFTLLTLGLVFALFPLLSRLKGRTASVLAVLGAVPFFYYVVHIFAAHALSIAANTALGRDASGLVEYMQNVFTAPDRLQGLGFSLPYVYLAWITVLLLLYPLCRWWAQVKAQRHAWWHSYL